MKRKLLDTISKVEAFQTRWNRNVNRGALLNSGDTIGLLDGENSSGCDEV